MANRKKNIQLKIWANKDEKKLIEDKMPLVSARQIRAYIRKIAIDGYIIYTETANTKEMNKEFHAIGCSINQIAKYVNYAK